MEEVPVFVISVALAVALIALFSWTFSTINAAKAVDYAYAFLYPYVKPYNSSYVLLGVAPREGVTVQLKAVEINGVVYLVDKNISGLTWLMPAPCGANVTFVSSYGSAQRANTWRILCMNGGANQSLSLPSQVVEQLANQLLTVGIVNPDVDFSFDPGSDSFIIHNLNNYTWLVAWSLPNNGIYSDPPQIYYEILPPYGTIKVPAMCGWNLVCTRGLNFYLLYPINATNLTSPLYLLYSTPSPVLKVPIGVTPYGVTLPSLANAPIQYAYLPWASNDLSLYIISSAQYQDLLSSTESGGFSPAPINQQTLQTYVQYYLSQQPSVDVSIYDILWNNLLYAASGATILNLTKVGSYYTGAVYVYDPYLCGYGAKQFSGGPYKLVVGGSTYYVENLTVYGFGYGCSFNQNTEIVQLQPCSFGWGLCITYQVGYSPATLNITLSGAYGTTAYGDVYVPDSSAPCGSFQLLASYGSGYYIYYGGLYYPIGSVNVYGVNPSCPLPTYSYSPSSEEVLVQFPTYNAYFAIPAVLGYGYVVTRSLSWAFQAMAWAAGNNGQYCSNWDLVVYSGNNTVTRKTITYLPPVYQSIGSCSLPPPPSPACYTSYSGPYDVSWYPTGPNTYDAYATYVITTICNGQVVSQSTVRVSTGFVLNGLVVYVQDPYHGNRLCGPAGIYVNTTYDYIGCLNNSTSLLQSG